jgi:hypothetical protein
VRDELGCHERDGTAVNEVRGRKAGAVHSDRMAEVRDTCVIVFIDENVPLGNYEKR